MGFWGWLAPVRNNPADITWWWDTGVQSSKTLLPALGVSGSGLAGLPGWIGLGLIGIVSGLVSGVAEALGTHLSWLIYSVLTAACHRFGKTR